MTPYKLTIRCKSCHEIHRWQVYKQPHTKYVNSIVKGFVKAGWVLPDETVLSEVNSGEVFFWGLCPPCAIADAHCIA
jgi:hypothetical protein